MHEELDKIGDLFRNTLKDHKLDSDAHLWDRLDTQLSAQIPVSVPKTSVIHHLTWVKVAVAASFIISAAFAFNYLYLPLIKATKNDGKNNTTQKINSIQPTKSIIDSSSVQNELKSQQMNHLERKENLVNNPELIQNQNRKQSINNSANTNILPDFANNNQPVQQNSKAVNIAQYPVNNNNVPQNNNVNKVIPDKDTLHQPINDQNIDRNQLESNTNSNDLQKLQKNEEVIKDSDIPNIFTPNSDGINDYFVIRNIDKCSNNHLVIKDRNGNTVFEKLNYQNDWDGRNVADGVYFYFLKCNTSNNNFGKMGSLTLRRQ